MSCIDAMWRGRSSALRSAVLGLITAILISVSFSAAAQSTATQTQDMSGILGPGSQLMAAPDGEFEIALGTDSQLDQFHAKKDVILLTKEIEMRCEDLVYQRGEGTINATAKPGDLVNIRMLGSGPSAEGSSKDVRAWCDTYKFLINEKRHILTGKGKGKPEVHQTDDKGKVMAFSGFRIVMTQRANGSWQIDVKGEPEIFNPDERDKLRAARQKLGNPASGGARPPTVAKAPTPRPATPKPTAKAPSIETGDEPRKSSPPRVVKIDEGGL